MLLQCLLSHCKHKPDDVLTLFQLLRVYLYRQINSFHFLTTYLETDVARTYTIEQKRNVFFQFVEVFSQTTDYPQELKAKILQYILIPMFTATFEEEKGDLLLGGPPDPEHDSNENIISVFINKVIDPEKPFGSTVCKLMTIPSFFFFFFFLFFFLIYLFFLPAVTLYGVKAGTLF